eukprot:TRINITY_DN7849_c0_g1_i1.p1 TRINITY_DN7849_c0_g1~~TRINITY_DN7849_c0_g1_i1.p1  ORF type:complete len:1149 (-),score=147.15 TRINITY_DN7849_c0_g1_i1:358-3804(-)
MFLLIFLLADFVGICRGVLDSTNFVGGACAKSDETCLADVKIAADSAVGDGRVDPSNFRDGCATHVVVSGADTWQASRMGVYRLMSVSDAGHPVYTNDNGQFLYYWPEFSTWLIGEDSSSNSAGLQSEAMLSRSSTLCPSDAEYWYVWDGTSWNFKDSVRVTDSSCSSCDGCHVNGTCHHGQLASSESICREHGGEWCAGEVRPECSELVWGRECEFNALAMARSCPGRCEEGLLQSKVRQRFLFENVISDGDVRQLLEFATAAMVEGHGFTEKRPYSRSEIFAGVTPVLAARWALRQPAEGGRQERAVNWARKMFDVVEKMRDITEQTFDAFESLSYDFIHLTCRRRDHDVEVSHSDSPFVHADNCFQQKGKRGEETCVRDSPSYWWRSHTVILELNSAEYGDFAGGNFFYAPSFNSPASDRVHVAPRPGRMVAFAAGEGNIYGVEPLTNGTRCQLAVWLTEDHERAASHRELHDARDVFFEVVEVGTQGKLVEGGDSVKQANRSFGDLCKRPQPAAELGTPAGELLLPKENRTLQLRSLGTTGGPQLTLIQDFLLDDEIDHVISIASAGFEPSIVNEGEGHKTVTYRTSETSWIPDNSEDAIISSILERIALITGLSLASAEHLQVAHYRSDNLGRYEPHLDWGTDTVVSRDRDKTQRGLQTGARMATFLMYLNDVSEGGGTTFVRQNISIKPHKGSALLWYNLHPSAEGDILVRHGACPVEAGEKYIMTKWIHELENEPSFAAVRNSHRFVRNWSGLSESLRLGGEAAAKAEEPLLERTACGVRVAAGHCATMVLQMALACSGHCEENSTTSIRRQRGVVDGVVDDVMAEDLLRLARQASVVGDGYGGQERPLSHREMFSGVQPRDAALWALQQPEGSKREAAVASVRALVQAARKLRAALVDIFSHSLEGVAELHFDHVHLSCREALELQVNDSRRLLDKWTRFDSPINRGGDLVEEEMTWWEAEDRCLKDPSCEGFTFHGPPVQEPVKIYIKNHASLYEPSKGWTSFVRKPDRAPNVTDSHAPHADNCHRTLRGNCRRALPSFHWRSHAAVLYLHGPESSDFEGGDFFYQPAWDSKESDRIRITPKAGRMIAYAAGAENIHGVESLKRGFRCTLAIWVTPDARYANHLKTLEEVEDLLLTDSL